MSKKFSVWCVSKEDIHENKTRVFFREREIWFVTLGTNIGFEQDGKGDKFLRPVIVLKKFNNEVLWCIPLTRNEKKGKYYFSFPFLSETSVAILSQIRLIDSKRLQYKIGDMSPNDFAEIKEKLKQLLT